MDPRSTQSGPTPVNVRDMEVRFESNELLSPGETFCFIDTLDDDRCTAFKGQQLVVDDEISPLFEIVSLCVGNELQIEHMKASLYDETSEDLSMDVASKIKPLALVIKNISRKASPFKAVIKGRAV